MEKPKEAEIINLENYRIRKRQGKELIRRTISKPEEMKEWGKKDKAKCLKLLEEEISRDEQVNHE